MANSKKSYLEKVRFLLKVISSVHDLGKNVLSAGFNILWLQYSQKCYISHCRYCAAGINRGTSHVETLFLN